MELKEFQTMGTLLSIQNSGDNSSNPVYFEGISTTINQLEKHLKGGKAYSFSIFNYNKRSQENFKGCTAIVLDMDAPGKVYTIEKTKKKLEKLKLPSIIITSKSHQKKKGETPPCDRYHTIIFLNSILENKDDFKSTARKLSELIFNKKDDLACHECSRMFYSSPENAEVHYIIDKNFEFFPIVQSNEAVKMKLERTSHSLSSEVFPQEIFEEFQKHIIELGLKYKISHYNQSNGTINFYRNDKDFGPGCYMFIEDNRIYDDSYNTVEHTNFSFKQLFEAISNSKIELESLRQSHLKKLLDGINTQVKINLLKSAEGVGKSTLVSKIKDKFNVERVVVLFKSYEQLLDKKVLLNKLHPELTIDIAYGTDRILLNNGIDITEYETKKLIVYEKDPKTGIKYIDLSTTLSNLNVSPIIMDKIWDMKRNSDRLCGGTKPVDILLTVEEKFKVEILIKKNMRKEPLVIFDEFYSNSWFPYRGLSDIELKNSTIRSKIHNDIEYQEAWEGVTVQIIKDKNHWSSFFTGQLVILSTEEVASEYIKKYMTSYNIIDTTTTFFVSDKFNYWSLQPKMLNKENKLKLSISFISNGFYNIGDGIQSNYNNVNMRGKNMYEPFKDKSLNVVASHPHPIEIAIYRKNLELNSKEARDMIITDNINQQLGRVTGFRAGVNPKEVNIFIPSNIIYNITPKFRYISKNIFTTPVNKENLTHRIISTLQHKICNIAKNSSFYLSSLEEKVSRTAEVILKKSKEEAIRLIPSLLSFKLELYSKAKELISRIHKSLNVDFKGKSTILYSDFIDLETYQNQVINMSYLVQGF